MKKPLFDSEKECMDMLYDAGILPVNAEIAANNLKQKGYINKSIDEIYTEFCQCKYNYGIYGDCVENDKWVEKAREYIEALENKVRELEEQNEKSN